MNRVDYETQVKALRKQLERAAGRGALAETLARLTLMPSLLKGENADAMCRRGADQLSQARLHEAEIKLHRSADKLSKIRADAEKLLFKASRAAGRTVIYEAER
jgi:hypothetical protein